jgi:hypothetical protein
MERGKTLGDYNLKNNDTIEVESSRSAVEASSSSSKK